MTARGLHVRPAREADLDRLIPIHVAAFPDPRGYDDRVRNFRHNPFGSFSQLRVIEDRGALVGHAFLFAFEAYFGGARVKCGGIASVGVAPEARGRGVASALMAALHDESSARGDAVTILYAYRQGFYARLGYAPATPYKELRFSPRAVPRAWRQEGVRRMKAADRDRVEAAHARAGAAHTGWIARKPGVWDRLLLDERTTWLVVERERKIAGYVAFSLAQLEPHAQTILRVHELVADDDDARRALLGVIGAQRDQVTEVTMAVALDDPLELALVDADQHRSGTAQVEHDLGSVVAGPMVRLADVARALQARGYPAADRAEPCSMTFALEDGALHRFVLRSERGEGPATRRDKRVVATTTRDLASVLYGGVSPDAAVRLGWLRPESPSLLPALRMLALPAYFARDPF